MNSIFSWFVHATIATAVMAPFVLGLSRLFRNRPSVQHAMWLVLLLKFVTPPIASLPVQLPMVVLAWISPVDAQELRPSTERARPTEAVGGISAEMRIHIPADVYGLDQRPKRMESNEGPGEHSGLPNDSRLPTPAVFSRAHVIGALFSLWLAGALVAAMRYVRLLLGQRQLLRGASVANWDLTQCMTDVARRLNVRPLPMLVVSGPAAPYVWCFGRLKLVWPIQLANELFDGVSKVIIAHELSHVRRRDHLIAWVEMISGLIWWWNPVFWFVRHNIRTTAEMSCDAAALAAYPEDRSTYAETLFALSVSNRGAPPIVLAVAGGARSTLERRIHMMMKEQVSSQLSLSGILAVALLITAAMPAWSLAHRSSPADETRSVRSAQDNVVLDRDSQSADDGKFQQERTLENPRGRSVPALGRIPYIGRLFSAGAAEHAPQDAVPQGGSVPVLSNIPYINRLFMVKPMVE